MPHQLSATRQQHFKLFQLWKGMKARCRNKNHKQYHNYGGRGIAVCGRWLVFENFLADMGDRPAGMTLDRIDNDQGYAPDNCRWATYTDQARNRTNNNYLEFAGRKQTASAWALEVGIKEKTIVARLARGWSIAKTLQTLTKKRSLRVCTVRAIRRALRNKKSHKSIATRFDIKQSMVEDIAYNRSYADIILGEIEC